MARDLKELTKMFKAIEKDLPNFYDDVLKEVAARYLSSVIYLTPVQRNYTYKIGDKSYAVRGGALKRGWIGEVEPGPEPSESDIENYVKKLSTGGLRITLANSVEYALVI